MSTLHPNAKQSVLVCSLFYKVLLPATGRTLIHKDFFHPISRF
jgi:hypothetical protein